MVDGIQLRTPAVAHPEEEAPMNRRTVLSLAVGGLALAACGGLTLDQIATSIANWAKSNCNGIIVNVADLVSALTGLDLSNINVASYGQLICQQFTVAQAQNLPKLGANKATVVIVNGRPVQVTTP